MTRLRTSSEVELFVELRLTGEPLHQQLERRSAKPSEGRLEAGTTVPSTRALARDLGLSRGVVIEAYEQLAARATWPPAPAAPQRVAEAAARRQPDR